MASARGAPLRIEAVDVRDPGPEELRVRVVACGICASDLHVWRTGEGIRFPAVLGHEASGIVESAGSALAPGREGQRVVIAWIPRCGTCRSCRAGRAHLCAATRTHADDGSLSFGAGRLGRYMSVGGLSERIVVPQRCAIPVPDALSLRSACAVGCGVTTGFGAVVLTGRLRRGESVAVFGCGGVGLAAVQGARIAGAARIIAVEPQRARRELAGRLGATALVSPDAGDVVAAVRELSGGGVDLAVEAAGSAAVARQAFDVVAPGGRAVVVGLTSHRDEIRVPVVSLLLDRSLQGSIHGSADPGRDFPELFEHALRGDLRLEEMLGPDYPLEGVNDAFEAAARGSGVRPRIVFEEFA